MRGKRAAWIDNEVTWISTPSIFEVKRLGLDKTDVILLDNQVTVVRNPATGEGMITVRYIEVDNVDGNRGELSYRVKGEVRLAQQWDVGGVNLLQSTIV